MLDPSKSGAVVWQRSALPVSSPSENAPSCLFSCYLIVDNEIKLNCTKSSDLPEQHSIDNVLLLSISSLPWKTHSMACA